MNGKFPLFQEEAGGSAIIRSHNDSIKFVQKMRKMAFFAVNTESKTFVHVHSCLMYCMYIIIFQVTLYLFLFPYSVYRFLYVL